MKILYTVPDGDDLGGIITSSENLMAGFREAGHEATFCLLKQTKSNGDSSRLPRAGWEDSATWVKSENTGMWYHPIHGWKGPALSMVSGVNDFIYKAKQHDVVVWGALFGLKNILTEGTTNWTRLFSGHGKPNIVMIRDDHLRTRYLWVAALSPWIIGWAGVQRVSFDSCAGLGRRAIIYSGHDVTPVDINTERELSVFSCQTFKSWKRVDRLVAAVPYMKQRVIVAGEGLQYHYMKSETKCKPQYICTLKRDPDAPSSRVGQPVWKNALAAGMTYAGSLKETERNAQMLRSKFFVDLSTREKSTGQINRTVVEAIRHGCIPIAVPSFISGNECGDGELFTSGQHYLPINSDKTPAVTASVINGCFSYSDGILAEIRANGLRLIEKFDRKIAAEMLADFGAGSCVGWDYAEDQVDEALIQRGKAEFEKIFGVMPC